MDSLDLEILSLIQNDARVAHASVGERLGLTAPAVHARIKRLEKDGVIRGYLTSIDPLAVNQSLLAFVRVMNNSAGKERASFRRVYSSTAQYSRMPRHLRRRQLHVKGSYRFTGISQALAVQDSRIPRSRTHRDVYYPFDHQRIRRTTALCAHQRGPVGVPVTSASCP